MGLTRIQVYLAEVVRRALGVYLSSVEATFGAVVDATAPDRDEWNRG